MTQALSPAAAIARDLIRCPSVTPAEGGALAFLERLLGEAGFTVSRVTFSDTDTPDVENLFATIGSGAPHFVFAGHTDVVPAGAESDHAGRARVKAGQGLQLYASRGTFAFRRRGDLDAPVNRCRVCIS